MSVQERAICERLVEEGRKLPKKPFAENPQADRLVRDLEHHPHAFVIACIVDRRIAAERAWSVPYHLSQRIGGFEFGRLHKLSLGEIREHMSHPTKLHPLGKMGEFVHAAIQRIAEKYQGRTEKIWGDCPTSARLVYRFLGFEGVGPKIATMAANILVRNFKVPISGHLFSRSSLDISPDRHVRRVFERLQLLPDGGSPDQIIYRARDLHPEYPGALDFPTWWIGRNWCTPNLKNLRCSKCFIKDICPTAR